MGHQPGEASGGSGIWPSLVEHLSELRLRIIYSALAVAAGTAIGFVYARPVLAWLIERGPDVRLVALAPAEAFLVTLRIAVLLGLALASPVVVYQALRFVWPGLTETERRYVRWYALPALVLFAAGIAFGLLVAVPLALDFLLGFNAGPIQRTLSVQAYVDFVTGLVWPFGFLFELPVVVALLTEIGLLTPPFMAHLRKYALLAALVVAAFLTPTTDVVTQLVFAVPLVALYEAGYGLCWLLHRRRQARGRSRGRAEAVEAPPPDGPAQAGPSGAGRPGGPAGDPAGGTAGEAGAAGARGSRAHPSQGGGTRAAPRNAAWPGEGDP
ncbi:MAG TPA: twin-arginine translocase subunit TatC [Thermaerobacter sp.]